MKLVPFATLILSATLLPAQTPSRPPAARPATPRPQPAAAPATLQYTADDYTRAEKFMPYNTTPLVFHSVDNPMWTSDNRVWFRDTGPTGRSFILVDPIKHTRARAFDHTKMATALTPFNRGQNPVDPNNLPIQNFALAPGDKIVSVIAFNRRFICDLTGDGTCTSPDPEPSAEGGRRRRRAAVELQYSPDGSKGAFIRDWNLWVRDLATGKEIQLTTDGVENYGYATDNAGWTHSNNAILVWSPDSKHIATFQQDQRKTGEMYLTNTTWGHPTLTTLKYPLVGDKDITMIERVVIDVPSTDTEQPKVIRLKMPPDQHRSSLCDDVSCSGGWEDVQWGADAKTLAFVSTSRDHKQEWMRIANPVTGDVRDVMNETVKTYFDSGNDKVNWRYLAKSHELLWFSERDNWGHLYLYDTETGKLKNQVTSGEWAVAQVVNVDEDTRTITFLGNGRESGEDPYYMMYYKVAFDGSAFTLLAPERANHTITPSPDNKFFVDSYSTPVEPQITVVRDAAGKIVADMAREDITRLKAAGWIPPVQIMVVGRDGTTDLHGFLFRPTNFSTDKKYPIIDHVYPGPQTGWGGLSCGSRDFAAAHGDLQALAELQFIVVCIDGMGGAFRSKAFHDTYFANMQDDTIPDQVTGIKQLAERYPWIDLNRVGMFGHSGGGNATASAMFHYPDFFKVGIAESGNHDNRNYEDDWGEKYQGLLVTNPDGSSNYDQQAGQATAKDLKGHLLLAHGTMDDNVPPTETLLIVDALIKANKDFDLIVIPNAQHGYGQASQYMTRRRWDYFVKYLAGATPPHEYAMRDYAATQAALQGNGPADLDWSEIVEQDDPQP